MTIHIKRELLRRCVCELEKSVSSLKDAMDEAQRDANAHKGAMASRYDTFKEEAQALRNGYAMQLEQVASALALVKAIMPEPTEEIRVGSMIETSKGEYFVCTGMITDPITVEGVEYQLTSFKSPLISKLRECKVGGTCEFAGEEIRLLSIK